MDPLNDFEFKPLTEGLGFHRKTNSLSQDMKNSNVVKAALTRDLPTAPPLLKTPLPSKNPTKPTSQEIDKLVETFKQPHLDFNNPQKLTNVAKPIEPQAVKWDFSPFIIDLMMVLAMFLFAFVVSMAITEVDIYNFMANINLAAENNLVIPSILLIMMFSYLTLCRIFTGATLGEFVFDLQLGTTGDYFNYNYSLKLLYRTVIILLTGVILLPLLSMILRNDIAGKISKLNLYKRANR